MDGRFGGLAQTLGVATELLEVSTAVPEMIAAPMTSTYDPFFTIGTSSSQTLNATTEKFGVVGMGGNDVLNGSTGSDFLVGDYFDPAALDYWTFGIGAPPVYNATIKGNDRLYGGDGNDLLVDDLGNDSLYGGNGDDVLDCFVQNSGANVFSGGDGYDILYFEDAYGSGYTSVTAGTLILDAAAGIERVEFWVPGLNGTVGNDTFDFSGVESLYVYDEFGASLITLVVDMGDGNDRFVSGDGIVAGAEVNGGSGNDTFIGGGWDDVFIGGTGADSMVGGAGGDHYFVDNSGDRVVELFEEDFNEDIVSTTLNDYVLPRYVEVLYFEGSGRFKGTGTNLDESLVGGRLNDTLIGSGGGDLLDGGKGSDSLVGGTGQDHFYVDNTGDLTVEKRDEGYDQVYVISGSSWTLSVNIEALLFVGDGNFKGTGNEMNNSITSQDGDDSLFGLDGDDSLSGNWGDDSLVGGNGRDLLSGGDDDDIIFGGLGADTMSGGAGADRFVFNSALGNGNVETVKDFRASDDTLQLKQSGEGLFNAISLGTLAADKFKVYGTGAVDGNDRVLYDSASGKIYYDADGSGATGRILFATLTPGTVLTSADFLVI